MLIHSEIRKVLLAKVDGTPFTTTPELLDWMKQVKYLDEAGNPTDAAHFTADVVRCEKVWNLYENGRLAAGVSSMSWLDRINGMRQLGSGLVQIKVQESLNSGVVSVNPPSGLNLRNN